MTLEAGTKLGHYEIVGLLGKGGMGEVYRARDPRLNREVAIKVSAQKFSERFAREAKVIASLNHPNICTLYDVGPDYLVMELVEGPTLADRIKNGPIPLEESLTIAKQIAAALEAAHEKPVIHRDLKPGNVKIRPDGTVKVLDFGLAKIGNTPTAAGDDSPTLTMGETQAGVILGTAGYMSPEQARGKPVDKRADIWSFGVVLYEMLTGRRLFQGETVTDTLAAVIEREPDWSRVPAKAVPLLRRCLEKDPQKRLRDIGEAMVWVENAPVASVPPARPKWTWAGAAVAAIAAAALILWAPWKSPQSSGQVVRFEVGPAEKMTFNNGGFMTVSPDGHWMVFPANDENGVTHYYLRSLDTVEVRALPGTETVVIAPPAFWSFDSRYVVFGAGNKLKKVDIQGGSPQTITDLPAMNGAAWNRDGVIVVGMSPALNGPLLKVSAAGGATSPVTALEKGDVTHRWPQFLPDGKHFLYQRVSPDPNKIGVYVGSLDAKPEEQSLKRLLASNRQAYYAASRDGGPGHLLFLSESTLMAQPFDPVKMELSGEPAAVAEGVDSFPQATGGLFSVSETGTLVYRGGGASRAVLTWFDAQGNPVGTLSEPGEYANPAVSPDGTRVAVAVGPAASRDIWMMDLGRGTNTRFTFDPASDDNPVWSPDSKNLVFASNRGGTFDLYVKPADGSGEERLLLKTGENKTPTSWSRDGRFLLYTSVAAKTGSDLWVLPMQGEPKPVSVLATQFGELDARFSPDGRWIAYRSNESSVADVYVRPFSPEAGSGTGAAKWMVSKVSSLYPHWRADGKELFYTTINLQQMAVDIDTGKGFQAGTPRRLFAAPSAALTAGWDMASDGKRFLFVAPPGGNRTVPFTVVLNWAAGLKK
jgi:Tol biopolymer transport system component/tRNA A-37 threonylcarbamoyl transferase component Bud32